MLSREWRCSWSSADRRCSNYIWVIANFIAYWGASYIRDFTVHHVLPASIMTGRVLCNPSWHLIFVPCDRYKTEPHFLPLIVFLTELVIWCNNGRETIISPLTHSGQDKMGAILQTFYFNFQLKLFPSVQLTTSRYLNRRWPIHIHIYICASMN